MILGVSDMILTLCIFSTHTPVTRRERPNLFWLFFQVQTAKYISERKTATASRMPHTCLTNHSHKERPKHKILALHCNIFTSKLNYQVSISFRMEYLYEQGLHLMF